ncbi:MAG: hypothetical protein ACC657_04910 [Thiohalomonadales bacterium]
MNLPLLNNNFYFKRRLRTKISNSNINSIIYVIIGLIILILYITQLTMDEKFDVLSNFQNNYTYKQVTGYLLLIYVMYQFRLAKARKNTKLIRYHCCVHKIQGLFAPLVLYVHSMELGYAYQVLLSSLFLTNCLIGLLSPQQLKIAKVSYVNSWLIVHVAIAILIVGLSFYHIFITYWYS